MVERNFQKNSRNFKKRTKNVKKNSRNFKDWFRVRKGLYGSVEKFA